MQTENKPLVVYFSATGTTAMVARTIADITGYCFTLFLQPSHEHIVLQIQKTVKTIEYKSLYLHAEETKSDIRAYSCFYRV